MRRIIFLTISLFFIGFKVADAQISVSVNIGTPPMWAPQGYVEARYYYLPDIDTYYDVHAERFIYLSRGRWVHVSTLPYAHRHYDLYNGYKVVLNYHDRPYVDYHVHRSRYPRGYRYGHQVCVREYRDRHPNHEYSKHNNKHDHHRGHNKHSH